MKTGINASASGTPKFNFIKWLHEVASRFSSAANAAGWHGERTITGNSMDLVEIINLERICDEDFDTRVYGLSHKIALSTYAVHREIAGENYDFNETPKKVLHMLGFQDPNQELIKLAYTTVNCMRLAYVEGKLPLGTSMENYLDNHMEEVFGKEAFERMTQYASGLYVPELERVPSFNFQICRTDSPGEHKPGHTSI